MTTPIATRSELPARRSQEAIARRGHTLLAEEAAANRLAAEEADQAARDCHRKNRRRAGELAGRIGEGMRALEGAMS
jgi:hypothetical protein